MSKIITAFIFSNLIISSALAFIPQSIKILRSLAIIAAGGLLTYIQFALAVSASNRYPFAALLTVHWFLLLRAVSLLLLQPQSSVPFQKQSDGYRRNAVKNNVGDRNDSFNVLALVQRLAKSLGVMWSFRTIPRAINNIPPFSNTDKGYVPSRVVFLKYEALKFVASLLVFLLADYAHPSHAEIEARFTSKHEKSLSRLGDISGEEILTRIMVLIPAGMGAWAAVTVVYSATAIIFVACGLSGPSSWPPLFGSLRESYTLRRFWGYILPCR
jgi:hypothetical protein